jgi:hypothetical protein
MHILCPHCHSPIELVKLSPAEEIACPACGSTFRIEQESTADWTPSQGRRSLGRFELIEGVGVGAFGTVYKARDPQLDRTVAIKVPRAGNLADREDLDRSCARPAASPGCGTRPSCRCTRSASTRAYPTWSATSSRA